MNLKAGEARASGVTKGLEHWRPMELSNVVAAAALVLAGLLVSGYSQAQEKAMPREGAAREAARQVAIIQHKQRKEEFARLCAKPFMSNAEMEACRAAYRRL